MKDNKLSRKYHFSSRNREGGARAHTHGTINYCNIIKDVGLPIHFAMFAVNSPKRHPHTYKDVNSKDKHLLHGILTVTPNTKVELNHAAL